MPGYKQVRGMLWPESDTDCMAVVFDTLPDLDLAVSYCKKFDVAVQAGGNCGVWPKHLAETFNLVYTFEPEPSNYHCLESNCSEPNIVCYPCALGAERRFVKMGYEHGLHNMGACYIDGLGEILMMRVDDLELPACDLIQFDLEGYDLEAIKGSIGTIERFHPVICVEDKGLSEKYGTPKGAIETFLSDYGYQVVQRPNRDVVLVWGGVNVH